MENNDNDENKDRKTPKINDKNGLNIAYDAEELNTYYPHLMNEITDKKKTVNINSAQIEIEQKEKDEKTSQDELMPTELINPGVLDFIKRCSNNDEAIVILDYLLERKEIISEEYTTLKNKILQVGGLKELVDGCGGYKEPGYYLRKYYKKEIKNQKLNTNKN